jgi:hypothetical protein
VKYTIFSSSFFVSFCSILVVTFPVATFAQSIPNSGVTSSSPPNYSNSSSYGIQGNFSPNFGNGSSSQCGTSIGLELGYGNTSQGQYQYISGGVNGSPSEQQQSGVSGKFTLSHNFNPCLNQKKQIQLQNEESCKVRKDLFISNNPNIELTRLDEMLKRMCGGG